MDTTRNDEAIARYNDGAMSDEECRSFSTELEVNSDLRSEVTLEQNITKVLRTEAMHLDATVSLKVAPSPVILERLAASAPVLKNRIGYYFMGAVAIIVALILFFVFQSRESTQPGTIAVPPAPVSPIIEQPHQPSTQSIPVSPAEPTKLTTVKPKEKKQSIDLDKELQPPAVYIDPKAHMPIERK